jgi:cell division protein FtsB
MKDFQKNRKIKSLFCSKISILFLMVVLFLLVKGTWGVYQKSTISSGRRDMASVQLDNLHIRKTDLKKEIERLDSRVGIEEELRVRYSLSKENEKVIVIIDEESDNSENIDESKKSFIGKTMSLFRKINLLE